MTHVLFLYSSNKRSILSMGNETMDSRLELYFDEIYRASQKEEWRIVEQKARAVLEAEAHHPKAMMFLGLARAGQGFEPEGENLILASLTLDSRNVEGYYYLGVLVLDQGRSLLAIDAFLHGIRIAPTSHPLHYQLGRAYERSGRHDEALSAYARAVDLISSSSEDALAWLDFSAEAKEAIVRLGNLPEKH